MSKTWLSEFLEQPSSKYFVRIDQSYLTDSFNAFGLKQKMSMYQEAFDLISSNRVRKGADSQVVARQASVLYGMIHQRFLLTEEGISAMHKKYNNGVFPKCPRVYCKSVSCLPFGVSDQPGEYTMKLYCPYCNDVYNMKDPVFANVDGAYFGPSYIHLYLQKYPVAVKRNRHYVPNIFGFKLCDESDVHVKDE